MEIQTASQFVDAMYKRYADLKYDEIEPETINLIRSRDKAIINRCRVALIECDEIGVDKYLFALDSVLREIEGDK